MSATDSLTAFNDLATGPTFLGNPAMSLLPEACVPELSRVVCYGIYKKCIPGIVLSDTSTWNCQVYQNDLQTVYPIPIERPCVNLCTAMETDCSPFFSLLGIDCAAGTLDYSNGDPAMAENLPLLFDQTAGSPYCVDYLNSGSSVVPPKSCGGGSTPIYAPVAGKF